MTAGAKRQYDLRRALRSQAEFIPFDEAEAVLDAAAAGHLRHLPAGIAVWLATASRIRHAHTDYDALLADGYDTESARFFVIDAINEVLADWGSSRRLSSDDGEDDPQTPPYS